MRVFDQPHPYPFRHAGRRPPDADWTKPAIEEQRVDDRPNVGVLERHRDGNRLLGFRIGAATGVYALLEQESAPRILQDARKAPG